MKHKKRVVLRCPIIPGINDTQEHIEAIAALADRFSLNNIEIMPYHGYGEDKWRQAGKKYVLSGLPNMGKETAALYREKIYAFRKKTV